jgi:hypothetical protein
MATNIKITALNDITSANMTYNDIVAVVDMNGTPETKKANVQLVGNLILSGSGGSNFAKAAQATNAETVSNAAQPAITSVGTLTAVTVTGNVAAGNVSGTAGVFTYVSGDGANLTNVPAGAATSITDGTSNVDIPTTDGNVTVGVGGTADVLIVTSTGVNVTGTLNTTGIITGDAGGISNVVYANVTGTPTLGNISTINIDGNVSNVLRGDGTFAADADTAYGDSNVVTLLNAFGSNTITTTGLITGDGGGISNVVAANISGTINLATFAGTANAVAGANVSGEVGFAAVANSVTLANVSGAGNIASINIDGEAGNVLYGNGAFAPVSATTAQTVTTAAQPNITSTGTLTSLDVTGNVNAGNLTTTGLITGDGSGLSAIAGGNVTGAVTFAGTANAVAGANVSGEVTFAATANAVAYANVSGTPTLGNISTIDIDGSASNVLYGNGVFAAAASPALTGDGYQLSNITGANVSGEVSFAATANAVAGANVSGEVTNAATANAVAGANVSGEVGFSAVSNSVAGANVSGEVTFAATANAVAYANVSGTPTLGNISTIDIDGDAANVLYGNGVFAAATSPALTGDGYQLSNITGANVSGEVGFAAVANSVALANVSGAGNIASINIDGDASTVLYGNGTFAAISATTAQTVTTAAQPNITSTGTLTSLTVTGALGVTTGVITGDGGGISNVVAGNISGTVNNAVLAQEVSQSAQPNIGSVGTLTALNVNDTIVSVGLTANTGDITVTAGVFAGDGGSISNVVGANVTGEVGFSAVANSVAIANVSGAGNIATVNLDGNTANYLDGTGSWGPVTATTATTAGTVTTAAQPNITSLGTLVTLDVTGNISGGNINANTNGFAIGYKEIPPVVLSANDTIALEDSGKHFRSTTAGNITLSIPTNATVAFPTGTAISIVEQAAGNILVNAISGVTLYHAGNSTAGNRVISTFGVATLMKVDSDTWFISGTGVS